MNQNHSGEISLDQAIKLLTSEDAAKRIDARIEQLEAELSRLKKIRKAIGGSSAQPRTRTTNLDTELESKLVRLIKQKGPMSSKEAGKELGVHYMKIGKTVAASDQLKKAGTAVTLAEAS